MELKINLCFIARDIEWNANNLSHLFYDIRSEFYVDIICYENDSIDSTVEFLKGIDDIYLESETLNKRKFPSDKSEERLEFLSWCRNKYLERVKNFTDNKVTIVIDSDLHYYNVEKIVENVKLVNNDPRIDGIFANGIDFIQNQAIYYDILPLIINSYSCNDKIRLPFDSTRGLIKVDSAFGGVGIYKTDKFINSWYSMVKINDVSGYSHLLCDHAGLNLSISGNFYIDPSFIVLR